MANFAYSPPLPSAVRSILEASPAITTLELGWSNGSGEEFENYTQLLCTLAPKLQKLVLCMDDDDDVATDSEQLLRTLTNCTSLRILVFSGTRAHQLAPVVSALPTPLLVLEIFQPTWLADDDTAREWAAALLKASNVPGLKELKGWRVYSEIGVDKKTGNGAAWVAQCEERGIEVRDERKLFTGECCMVHLQLRARLNDCLVVQIEHHLELFVTYCCLLMLRLPLTLFSKDLRRTLLFSSKTRL